MEQLPTALYSVAQVRAFDAHAIATQDVTGLALMQRAGAAALRLLRVRWPRAQRIAVVCGAGNNGGDGYVLARLLRQAGLDERVCALTDISALRGDARLAADQYLASGGQVQALQAGALAQAEVIVDAVLGTGFTAPLRGGVRAAIEAINAAQRPVLALDVPSGLDADSGHVAEIAVQATVTLSFVALKQGLLLNEGPDWTGELHADDLQVQLPQTAAALPVLTRLSGAAITNALPPRRRAAHKGEAGRVLIIGGNTGMAGAVLLAGEAALRAGAGLVRIATRPEHAVEIVARRPELMTCGIANAAELSSVLAAADVVAIGPGLGLDAWAAALLDAALACGKSLIVDADALNAVASRGLRLPPGSLITPHPGEAARLLGCATAAVQAERLDALHRLVALTGAVTVLKGAGSLVGAPGQLPAICSAGNPGMATAGMGDVLTGVIAGLLAQCRNPWLAACAGVYAHATAADAIAARLGSRGLLAAEVAAAVTPILNQVAG